MKVYVPKNHNKLLLSNIKYGECFWFQEQLYIKTNAVHYTTLVYKKILNDSESLDAVKLSDGILYHWFYDPVILMESDVAVLELSKNE